MGLEIPSQSLGYAHVALLGLLAVLAVWQPPSWVRLSLLVVAFLDTLSLPVLWVGPLWAEPPELRRFAWGFFLSLVSSLAIPFAFGAVAVTALARRSPLAPLRARLLWPPAAYLVGLLVSLPVSFNYALGYPLIR